eukprot:1396227-Pyramimonas_sp.AAC.1
MSRKTVAEARPRWEANAASTSRTCALLSHAVRESTSQKKQQSKRVSHSAHPMCRIRLQTRAIRSMRPMG